MKNLLILFVSILSFCACTNEKENNALESKAKVSFNFDAENVSVSKTRTVETNLPTVYYQVYSSDNELVASGYSQENQLKLELIPDTYRFVFTAMSVNKNILSIEDLKDENFYKSDQIINVPVTGITKKITLTRFISKLTVQLSTGLEPLKHLYDTQVDIISYNNYNILKGLSEKQQVFMLNLDKSYLLFPGQVTVRIKLILKNKKSVTFYRTFMLEPNENYVVTARLFGGGEDGTDIGGIGNTFEINSQWGGTHYI